MKIKKVALLLSVLLLLILSFGCQNVSNSYDGKEDSDYSENQINTSEDSIDEHLEEDINHTEYWSWKEGVYSNSFVGLTFETFEGWSQYTNEELIQLQDDDYANLYPTVKEMYKERIVYAACSSSEDKDSSFKLCYENKHKLEDAKGEKVSLSGYVAESKVLTQFMYKDVEILNEGDIDFCGNTYKYLELSIYTNYNGGGYIRKNIYYRQVDDYFVTLTLTAGPFGNETIDDIVARCFAL